MTANVIQLRPHMPDPPQAARHYSSLEVWLVQAGLTRGNANDDHWRWLALVAGAQAVDILDDYDKTMDGLTVAALDAGQLPPAGFLDSTRAREAMRVALLAALAEEIADRAAAESADVLAGEVSAS